jgi:hypothetical protein
MTKVFRIGPQAAVEAVAEAPFADEVSDLESFVKNNPGILGERVRVFAEQVDTGLGRMDLLAMDQSLEQEKLLLIELKNKPADTNVLLQVLRYASWVSTSPDSIKLLLEKSGLHAENADLKPKVVIVAPDIEDEPIELSQYIAAFEFSFLPVKRFRLGSEFLAVVESKTIAPEKRTPVSVQEEWDWERYERDLRVPKARLDLAKWLVSEIQNVCAEKGWSLEFRFRKGYTPFQMPGGWNVIGTENRWAKGWCIWFKLPAAPEELALPVPSWTERTYWGEDWHIFYMNVTSRDIDFGELDPFFEQAYAYVAELSGSRA